MKDPLQQRHLLGITPIDSYFDLLTHQKLISCPEILDYRIKYDDKKLNTDNNWFYFFTCFFAIHRKRLPNNIRFLEELNGWGAEDIEFAYKTSLQGKLYFNRKINNIHIPHNRDHVKNLINNHKNLYILLRHHPILEFEILLTFSSPGESVERVKEMVNLLSTSNIYKNTSIFDETYHDNCLYTSIYSINKWLSVLPI